MRENQDVETVADNKPPEAPPPPSATPPRAAATTPLASSTPEVAAPPPPPAASHPVPPPMPSVLSNDHSLGQIMAMARERRGGSRDQAALDSNIPGYYLTMIESDDYSSIADQLYLLPFLRRYAIFVGLDPEEVASRFIRDVQRADMNATRMSEPIAMIDHSKRPFPWVEAALGGAAVLILVLLIWLAYQFLFSGKSTPPPPPAPRAAQVMPAAPAAAVPPRGAIPAKPKTAAPRPHAPAAQSETE